jgi:hypothetical protein
MLSRHEIYETSEYTPAQKIAIFTAIVFALVLIAIAGKFAYEFVQDYRSQLNQALLYGLGFIAVLGLILLTYAAFYVMAILALHYQTKRLYAEEQRQQLHSVNAHNQLFTATAEQIRTSAVYLSEQKTEQGIVRFKSLPKHIAHQRNRAGNVLILDSHNHVGKWNDDFRIVGHGRDYSAIEKELKNLVAVMDSRYKEYSSGKVRERDHDLITVISDEWTTIAENLNNLDAVLLPLLIAGAL